MLVFMLRTSFVSRRVVRSPHRRRVVRLFVVVLVNYCWRRKKPCKTVKSLANGAVYVARERKGERACDLSINKLKKVASRLFWQLTNATRLILGSFKMAKRTRRATRALSLSHYAPTQARALSLSLHDSRNTFSSTAWELCWRTLCTVTAIATAAVNSQDAMAERESGREGERERANSAIAKTFA